MFGINSNREELSVLKEPFFKERISTVVVHMFHLNSSSPWISGYVEFKNGDTEGKQQFKGKDFIDLVTKMDAFIKSLK